MAIGYSPMQIGFRQTPEEAGSFGDLGQAISQGMTLGMQPRAQANQLLASMLENKIKGVNAKYAPEMAQASLREKLASAARSQQLASQPYGGMLSGLAKEAYGIAQLTGQNPNDVAKKLYENKLRQADVLNEYRSGLVNTQGIRSLTNLGKLQHEEEDVLAGYEPGTNRQHEISPERQQELIGQYQLQRNKIATDTDTRKKAIYAENMDKTLESINPEALTQYAGIPGEIEKRSEQGKALFGKESQKYDEYNKSLVAANLLAHQIRQFYGDSIQPAVTNAINNMVNPATWKNNPKLAMQSFNAIKDILEKEKGTYRQAMKGAQVFRGKSQNKGMTRVFYNGKPHMVPNEKVKDALAAGGSLNG